MTWSKYNISVFSFQTFFNQQYLSLECYTISHSPPALHLFERFCRCTLTYRIQTLLNRKLYRQNLKFSYFSFLYITFTTKIFLTTMEKHFSINIQIFHTFQFKVNRSIFSHFFFDKFRKVIDKSRKYQQFTDNTTEFC